MFQNSYCVNGVYGNRMNLLHDGAFPVLSDLSAPLRRQKKMTGCLCIDHPENVEVHLRRLEGYMHSI